MTTKMSSTKKDQSATHYDHTPWIYERRRSLFPPDIIDSDEDSDLGHISPLSYDSDQEVLKYLVLKHPPDNSLLPKTDSIGDYDIIGVVDNIQPHVSTPLNNKNYACSENMSPLYLSPYSNRLNSVPETGIVNETPSKISPSYSLKTPHDASNNSVKLPKLVRKSLLDTLESSCNKRKLSPYHSPDISKNKQFKLDSKNSKVRTTLFPEVDVSLSTKIFYPKTIMENVKMHNKADNFPKSNLILRTSRKPIARKKIGQINAGVGHKIRKPKQKKANKALLVKTAVTALGNSAINEYIKDLKELKVPKNEHKLIENKENTDPKITNQGNCIAKFSRNEFGKIHALEIDINKKRPLSPGVEPDPNKKFFKFSRSSGVVTVNKNIKVQVDNGKMTLIEKANKKNMVPKFDFDSSDLTVDEPLMPQASLDDILTSLDTEELNIDENCSKIILHAHSSVSASENSILLHSEPGKCAGNLILSPISQMCDVTSGLALNSPKKGRNLTSILNEMPNASSSNAHVFNDEYLADQTKQKFFSIFSPRNTNYSEKKDAKVLTRTAKKFKVLEKSQMLLDAGQKKFGVTQCPECNIVYHIGDPSDESMHLNYHNAGHVLRFAGWKNERVVADFQNNGRIIQILPEDSKIWWKKVKDLIEWINRELGCYDMEFGLDNCQVYLYIKSRTIAGCVVAVSKTEGHRMLTTNQTQADLCSEETYPIKCGISRIWVSHNYRKQGIATALMNAVKNNFMIGYILENCDVAISPPTDMGKTFAESYFKTQNYLIYYL